MTPFYLCFALGVILAFIIGYNAYKKKKGSEGDEIIYTDETHFD